MLNILYEDEQIIVVWKPVGLESQSSRGFGADMVSEIQRHIHKLSPKGGEPYVGVIHRLDKPVSGVMVYAKDKKAAASLSKQVADHKMTKKYLAVLCGKPVDSVDNFVDYLLKDPVENSSRIVDKGINGAKRAELRMRALETKEVEPYGTLTLAEIELLTGRHHQIRVQMAGHGLPLWGDQKYNPEFGGGKQTGRGAAGGNGRGQMQQRIRNAQETPMGSRSGAGRVDVGLSAYQIGFVHPGTGERMEFERVPDGGIFGEFVGRE